MSDADISVTKKTFRLPNGEDVRKKELTVLIDTPEEVLQDAKQAAKERDSSLSHELSSRLNVKFEEE